MAHLFISYARRDGSPLAHRLAADLQARGHEPWLDKREIDAGDLWSLQVETGISSCDALLALLTAGAYESSICRGELLRALRLGKRVVPLLVQAAADRPVVIEGAHYLDFTDEACYAERLAELLAFVAGGGGVLLAALPPRAQADFLANTALGAAGSIQARGPADWAALEAAAAAQFARFCDGLGPRGAAPGLYEAELHVDRPAARAELDRFAEGRALALILVGQPGCGKTHLLVHWCRSVEAAGDAVLFYPGERLDALRLAGELARDLGYEDGIALAGAWPALEALAVAAGRRLWIVVDGLDDCRAAHDAPRQLMLAVDSLVSRLPGLAVRVIVSCTEAAWQRMARAQGALRLAWGRYHATRERSTVLDLDRFTPAEAEGAWALHAARLELPLQWRDLLGAMQQRLAEPLMLRLLAEALVGQPAPDPDTDFDTIVFQRYFAERIGGDPGRDCVAALAGEMLAQRQMALPLGALAALPAFAAWFDELGQPQGTLAELIDEGVIAELPGDGIEAARLRFAYPQIGALAMVRALLPPTQPDTPLNSRLGASGGGAPQVLAIARRLAAAADDLPLAWEAAIALMVLRADDRQFGELAADADPELRELALQSIVRLHGSQPAQARQRLALLLSARSPEQHRTALRATFSIGPAARDLLIRSALHGTPELKQAVRDTLYFIWNGASRPVGESRANALYFVWRRVPGFTRALMDELVARLSLLSPFESKAIVAFVLDLTIAIYINHCERADVIEQTAALFKRLTVEKLHLDKLQLGTRVERLLLDVVGSVFAERLLGWMLLDGEIDAKAFFASANDAGSERALLLQAVPLFDPGAELEAGALLLSRMFRSSLAVVRGSAALAVAVHMLADAERAAPPVEALFDALDERGRGWLLAGFSVLLPDTPPAWLPLLESFTQRLVEEAEAGSDAPAPETAAPAGPAPILPFFDALHVPLGLAYAKHGAGMPLFEAILQQAAAQPQAAARLVSALGIVGFYHPAPVLALIEPHLKALLDDAATQRSAIAAVATIRTLHFEDVDALLARTGTSDAQRRHIVAGADPARVQQFMRLLGYHNNAVHFCVHYPRMRRGLAMRALELLATAATPGEFVAAYAQQAIAMAREAGFDLHRWTLPDPAPATERTLAHA